MTAIRIAGARRGPRNRLAMLTAGQVAQSHQLAGDLFAGFDSGGCPLGVAGQEVTGSRQAMLEFAQASAFQVGMGDQRA